MSKFSGKHRHQNFFLEDDDFSYKKPQANDKKRKSENAEIKKMRLQQYEEDNYGYDFRNSKKNRKYTY